MLYGFLSPDPVAVSGFPNIDPSYQATRHVTSKWNNLVTCDLWSSGAMVLGKLPVPGRPTNLDNSRTRAYCA